MCSRIDHVSTYVADTEDFVKICTLERSLCSLFSVYIIFYFNFI